MLARFATLLLALVLPAGTAHADKFYFGAEEDGDNKHGNAGLYVEGVLLRTLENGDYVIRVQGGEVTLPKDMVQKIVQDGLTVGQIEQRERDNAEALAAANARRAEDRQVRVAEASARVESNRSVEPPQPLHLLVDFRSLMPNYVFKQYDPVLRRANLGGVRNVIDAFLDAGDHNGRRDLEVVVDFQGLMRGLRFKTFNPVIDRLEMVDLKLVVEDYLRREVLRAAHRHE
ncbi:MAG: hypothetical protein AAF628_09600 [Planctomycetota bacterium]